MLPIPLNHLIYSYFDGDTDCNSPERDLNKTARLTSWISFAYTEKTGVYLRTMKKIPSRGSSTPLWISLRVWSIVKLWMANKPRRKDISKIPNQPRSHISTMASLLLLSGVPFQQLVIRSSVTLFSLVKEAVGCTEGKEVWWLPKWASPLACIWSIRIRHQSVRIFLYRLTWTSISCYLAESSFRICDSEREVYLLVGVIWCGEWIDAYLVWLVSSETELKGILNSSSPHCVIMLVLRDVHVQV